MIDFEIADMKNIGGRNAGVDHRRAIPPALRQQRALGDHLDIAGTAMDWGQVADQSELGFGLGRQPAQSARRRALREIGDGPRAG